MKNTTKWSLGGLLLVLLTGPGCERQVVRGDYFPFRDGNRWEYRLLDSASLKKLQGNDSPQKSTLPPQESGKTESDSSLRAETIQPDLPKQTASEGKSMDSADSKIPVGKRVVLELQEKQDELTYRAHYDGAQQVWSKKDGYISFQNARGRHYLLILPPHSSYRWVVTDDQDRNLYYEIEGHGELVTPAGIFQHCAVVKQETRDRRVTVRYWFAEGVGMVRRSKYYGGDEVFRQELVSHTLKPSTASGRKAEEEEVKRALKGKKRGTEFQRKGKDQKAGFLNR